MITKPQPVPVPSCHWVRTGTKVRACGLMFQAPGPVANVLRESGAVPMESMVSFFQPGHDWPELRRVIAAVSDQRVTLIFDPGSDSEFSLDFISDPEHGAGNELDAVWRDTVRRRKELRIALTPDNLDMHWSENYAWDVAELCEQGAILGGRVELLPSAVDLEN